LLPTWRRPALLTLPFRRANEQISDKRMAKEKLEGGRAGR
jgi:hypothetical protein